MRDAKLPCGRYNCSECTSCVYDEDYTAQLCNVVDDKKEEEIDIYCNGCIYSESKNVKDSNGVVYKTWSCEYCSGKSKIIDINVREGVKVKPPSWCGLIEALGYKQKEEEKKKMITTYPYEKRDAIMRLECQIPWGKIKVGEVYHIPPIMEMKRKDILVTSITEFSLNYRELLKDGKISQGVQTLYPTSMQTRFLTQHKIREIVVESRK